MTAPVKPRFTRKIFLFVLLGLATLVFYLYYSVGTANVVDVLERTNLFYFTSAFIVFLVSIFFSSLVWHSLLRNLDIKTKMRRVLLLTWAGMFFDATVPDPGWSGDLSKAYMLAKSSGQDAATIVASVVGQKIISMVITVMDLVLGLALLAWNYTLPSTVLTFIAAVLFLTVFSLVIVSYVSAKPKVTKRLLDLLIRVICFVRRGKWDPVDFRFKAERMLKRFHESVRTLSANPRRLIRPSAFSLVSWGFDVSVIFLIFAALGSPVPVDKVLIVYALTGSMQAMGISFVGFTEIVMSGSYTVLGILPAVSVSATLLTRVVTLWFKLIAAYLVFQFVGVEILTKNLAAKDQVKVCANT